MLKLKFVRVLWYHIYKTTFEFKNLGLHLENLNFTKFRIPNMRKI
jgi:hypothetical protein